MILVDYSALCMASLLKTLNSEGKKTLDIDYGKHIILHSLRSNIKAAKGFGKVAICCDSYGSWRKNKFPHYKAKRKSTREKTGSHIAWEDIFTIIDETKKLLITSFPAMVLEKHHYEADDIIAAYVYAAGSEEAILIISEDKDFYQLLERDNTFIFHSRKNEVFTKAPYKGTIQLDTLPAQAKFLNDNQIKAQLQELIIKGDTIDGIPNVLSDDDCFVEGKRQSPITQKRLAMLKDEGYIAKHPDIQRNMERNRMLIELKEPALSLSSFIQEQKDEFEKKLSEISAVQLQNVLMNEGLIQMASKAQDFFS